MSDNSPTSHNPIQETPDDRLERELKNNQNVLMSIDRRLEEIYSELESNTAKIEILEETLSRLVHVPSLPLYLRFDQSKKRLYLNKHLYVPFEKNEAEFMSTVFTQKGKPKKTKFQCVELAQKFSKDIGEMETMSAVRQTAQRINDKLRNDYNTGDIFTIKTKELYFSFY